MVNSFPKVSMKTSLFPYYVLDDALGDNAPDGGNGINNNNSNNNNNDNENCNYDMIMHFVEPIYSYICTQIDPNVSSS